MYPKKKSPIKNHGIDWTPYQIRLQRNLARYMREKDFSVQKLSLKTQIGYQVIQEYLKGKTATPPLKNITRLAWGLGITIKELLA